MIFGTAFDYNSTTNTTDVAVSGGDEIIQIKGHYDYGEEVYVTEEKVVSRQTYQERNW